MPKATVVISTFNRSQCLIKALESFLDQGSRDYQILVIDQNPNPDVKLLEFIQNLSERV